MLPKEFMFEIAVTELGEDELDRMIEMLRERALEARREQALELKPKVLLNGHDHGQAQAALEQLKGREGPPTPGQD